MVEAMRKSYGLRSPGPEHLGSQLRPGDRIRAQSSTRSGTLQKKFTMASVVRFRFRLAFTTNVPNEWVSSFHVPTR